MPTTTPTFEGFSISHAAILNGTTGVEESWGGLYGVREGSVTAETDNFDNTGDDNILSSWFWFKYATIAIKGGFVPFEAISHLTGSTETSSAVGGDTMWALPVWEQGSLNQPTRPMLIKMPSKDTNGLVRDFYFILYKVQFQPISFAGPSYKTGLELDYGGRALISAFNEKGVDITGGNSDKKAIARMVNAPAGWSAASLI